MSGPEIEEQDTVKIPEDKVEKEEMVGYLTSEGKIRNKVANDLFDAGLDNWNALVNGDLEFFMKFKNVGKKTAENLMEAGAAKKKQIQDMLKVPTLEEALIAIPRVSEKVIIALKEAGYNTFEKFKNLDPEELTSLKGIGPKLSITIVEKINEIRERFNITDGADDVEDAVGIVEEEGPEDEEKEEKGFFQKLIEGIKSIFSGKKDEEKAEEETTENPSEEEKVEEEPAEEEKVEEEVPEQDEAPDEPAEEEKVEEEVPEEPKDEEPAPEEKAEEPEEEEKTEDEEPSEEKDEEEPAEEEKGFFQKLKERFFGSSEEKTEEEAPKVEKKIEEEPAEEEKTEGEPEKKDEPQEEEESKKGKGPLGLKGVSVAIQEKLIASGYHDVEELKEAVPEDLTMIEGIGEKTAKRICDAVKE